MKDEQLLKKYIQEEFKEWVTPFDEMSDDYKQAIRQSPHFAVYKSAELELMFWQALERKAMMNDIKKQNNSKK